ncbi:MAG: class I SAM-dependent methyltransferase [Thiobacillaceae bacterium]|jgi:predicted O-methyltransferase YrrM|nr:class I SAM-dependent methyltransferase [Thiobacillaceae bacterium]
MTTAQPAQPEHAAGTAPYQTLAERLDLRRGLPWTANWTAAADFLALIVDHALAARPATIVECGSGLSTLMLARCCALNGAGQVHSLESGASFAAETRAELARYGLDGLATVLDAPLVTRTLQGRRHAWYDLNDLPLRPIDMLVVDGPPGFLQPLARYPALPLLRERLAPGCVIFLDDAARPDERQIVALWRAEFPDLGHEYLATERGCSILRARSGQPGTARDHEPEA